MPHFRRYDEIVSHEPTPAGDIQWLAGRITELPAFKQGTAVYCGSVAWGTPSWRSDIDIAMFRTESNADFEQAVEAILRDYHASTAGRYLSPKVDVIVVGAESTRLVTRENLVAGSMPITSTQTVREMFEATSLRFFDHIGALAKVKGEPWRTFHKTYLSTVRRTKTVRHNMLREYVTSFAETWRHQPLRSAMSAPSLPLGDDQLDAMGFAENFPFHLMRQILAERSIYPAPDRADDIKAAFAELSRGWAVKIRSALDQFVHIEPAYTSIVEECRSGAITAEDYHRRLIELFDPLPFAQVEEVVWEFLSSREVRKPRRWMS